MDENGLTGIFISFTFSSLRPTYDHRHSLLSLSLSLLISIHRTIAIGRGINDSCGRVSLLVAVLRSCPVIPAGQLAQPSHLIVVYSVHSTSHHLSPPLFSSPLDSLGPPSLPVCMSFSTKS